MKIGQNILHYKILDELGRGGVGVVYKAEDTRLGRTVALKFLSPYLTQNAEARARFIQEAQAASALDHQNICTIHQIDETDDGQLYIVMAYYQGETLQAKIAASGNGNGNGSSSGSGIEIAEAVDIATQIAAGLARAHEAGIIHRDIKPSNIIVTDHGEVKILDFGIAKLAGQAKVTRTGATLGTVAYMSPEQLQNQPVDHRTDIWSLGVVLYEMLTGQVPFRGEIEQATMFAIVSDDPAPVASLNSEVPAVLEAVVSQALAKECDARYGYTGEVLAALSALPSANHVGTTAPAASTGKSPPSALTSKMTVPVRWRVSLVWIFGVVVAVVFTIEIYRFLATRPLASPRPSMEFTQLTNEGNVRDIALSPDGKSLAYVTQEDGHFSLWIRQIATTAHIQILPFQESPISSLIYSPDGDYIYYRGHGKLNRIPALGGNPHEIGDYLGGDFSISPDGKHIAFARNEVGSSESRLMVANIDGSNEKTIVIRDADNPYRNFRPAWSSDGKSLVASAMLNQGGVSKRILVDVPVAGGVEERLTPFTWTGGVAARWLPGTSSLIVLGWKESPYGRLWHLVLPSGEVTQLTSSLEAFDDLDLAADGKTLATVRKSSFASIWTTQNLEMDGIERITPDLAGWGLGGLCWTHDKKIIYSAESSGWFNLWIMNADGSGERQLTFGRDSDYSPILADEATVVFLSKKTGSFDIWCMSIDGQNAQRLTTLNAYNMIEFSANDQWVVYHEFFDTKPGLWRIPIDGGEVQKISDYWIRKPMISPDGTQIACHLFGNEITKWCIGVIPIAGGTPIVLTDEANEHDWYRKCTLQWRSDGKAIAYVKTEKDVSNIWLQALAGGEPQRLTDFRSDQITDFAWSPDGEALAIARGRKSADAVIVRNFH